MKNIFKILIGLMVLVGAYDLYAIEQFSRVKVWGREVLTKDDLNAEFDAIVNGLNTKLLNGGTTFTIVQGDSILVLGRGVMDTLRVRTVFLLEGDIEPDADGAYNIGTSGARIDTFWVQDIDAFHGVFDSLSVRDSLTVLGPTKINGITSLPSTTLITTPLTMNTSTDTLVKISANGSQTLANFNFDGGGSSGIGRAELKINSKTGVGSRVNLSQGGTTQWLIGAGAVSDGSDLEIWDNTKSVVRMDIDDDGKISIDSDIDTLAIFKAGSSQTKSNITIDGATSSGIGRAEVIINSKTNVGSLINFKQGTTSQYIMGAGAASDGTVFELFDSQSGAHRLYIDDNGNVGIANTISLDHDFEIGSGTYSEIDAGEASFATSSDSTLKKDITTISPSASTVLSAINQVKTKKYKWNENAFDPEWVSQKISQDSTYFERWHIGMMAQDWHPVAVMMGANHDDKSIDWNYVTMFQMIALQTVKDEILTLRNRVSALESTVDSLKSLH